MPEPRTARAQAEQIVPQSLLNNFNIVTLDNIRRDIAAGLTAAFTAGAQAQREQDIRSLCADHNICAGFEDARSCLYQGTIDLILAAPLVEPPTGAG